MSLNYGKKEVIKLLTENFPEGSTILDVGAYDGKWYNLLVGGGLNYKMDAIEIFEPSIEKYKLREKYGTVYAESVVDFVDKHPELTYDVIIMGDVLEHLTVENAQKVVQALYPRCKELIIAVPYKSKRHSHYGNKYEIHLQPDLTDEIFHQRYPGFERFYFKRLFNFLSTGYAYYKKSTK